MFGFMVVFLSMMVRACMFLVVDLPDTAVELNLDFPWTD
jgi:hypothetical protein